MRDIYSNFNKVLRTIKSLNLSFIDEYGHMPRHDTRTQLFDIGVVSLSLVAEYMSLDSENSLLNQVKNDCSEQVPHLIERSRYNRRKRQLFPLMEKFRQALTQRFIEFEVYFIIESFPLEVCRISREKCAKIYKESNESCPDKSFRASQNFYFFLAINYKQYVRPMVFFYTVELKKSNVHETTFKLVQYCKSSI